MNNFILNVISRMQSERGQALAEYALILAFVAIVCVAALAAIGSALIPKLQDLAAGLV